MTTTDSRRRFLRHAGLLSGGALLVRYAPADFFGAPAQARTIQAAAAKPDAVAAIRAQMALLPIQTTRLGDRLVLLSGPGGNVVVLHGADGKVVVDSFVQPAWPKLKAAIDGLEGAPVKTLIDTHWHFDHTDNNANFRAAGAAIVAHANTKTRMGESHDLLGMHFDPSPAAALPTETFTQKHALRANGEEIALTSVPPAHTDTDIFVHYAKGNVLHMGDTFFNGMYPFIDAGTGGRINGMIGAAERGLAIANATTKIVPGHGPVADRAVLESYRAMLTAVRDRVRTQKGAGRTLVEVQAAKPTAEFDAVWGKGMMPPDNFVALVYGTL
jgi:glyoxylase-like metal-dependent hydrolase (beta-lactamase superfamily II)